MQFSLDLADLRQRYAAGLAAETVVAAVYRRIAEIADPGIFIALVPEGEACAAAAALGDFDPALPLFGVPFAVKDNIDVAGLPTTAACPAFAYVPDHSAPAVERLLAAGAILIGKTNLDQFATGLVGVRTPYPVPRNALDAALVPGGSSSGSAVAVAVGIVGFALGTDTAGSGRVPAALNNIVGLKPSVGAISTRGVVPACRTLDCISVFAGSVADAWQVFEVAAAFDESDPFSRPVRLAPALPPVVRLGQPDAAGRIFGAPAAGAAFDAAASVAEDMFGRLRPVDLAPFFETAGLLYGGPYVAERQAAVGAFIAAHPDAVNPVTREVIALSDRFSAADVFTAQYRLAALRRQTGALWRDLDILVVPSIPDVCTMAEIAEEPLAANARLGTYTNFVNLLDLCAVSIPGPSRADGLPAGITLIGPAGRDGLLAAVAERLHAAFATPVGALGRTPPAPALALAPALATGGAPAGHLAVAVVGAHLSGMALNRELTDRGGVFVRAAETAPEYRLVALPGGPPHRPGLVRAGPGGRSIALEVWALPPDGFGAFVAGIPAPLGIGTLRLADGSRVQGFLCEAIAAEGARDISDFGGWRAYVSATAA